jgi:hypothetical protein
MRFELGLLLFTPADLRIIVVQIYIEFNFILDATASSIRDAADAFGSRVPKI